MKFIGYIFFILWWAQCTTAEPFGQLRSWGLPDGFDESFSHKVSVTPEGNLIVVQGHVDTINYLNGYAIRKLPTPGFWQSTREAVDGTIWAGYGDTNVNRVFGLQRFVNNVWQPFEIEPIKSLQLGIVLENLPFLPISKRHVYYLTPDSLHLFDAESGSSETLFHVAETKLGSFCEFASNKNQSLWITGQNGLISLNYVTDDLTQLQQKQCFIFDSTLEAENLRRVTFADENESTIYGIADSKQTRHKLLLRFLEGEWEILEHLTQPEPDYLIDPVAIPARKGYVIEEGDHLVSKIGGTTFPFHQTWNLQPPFTDYIKHNDHSFVVTMSTGMTRWSESLWNKPEYLIQRSLKVQDAFLDSDQRIWFRAANQLIRLDGQEWLSYPFAVSACYPDSDGRIWAVQKKRLLCYEDGQWVKYPTPLGITLFDAIAQMPNGNLIIQCADNAIIPFSLRRREFITPPIVCPDGDSIINLYSSFDGVWVEGGNRFFHFDGTIIRCLFDKDAQRDMASNVLDFRVTQSNQVWIADLENIIVYKNGQPYYFDKDDGYTARGGRSIGQRKNGNIVIGGLRGRIHEYDGTRWRRIPSPRMTVCTDILERDDGSLWFTAGHHVYRYNQGSWVSHAQQEGLPELWMQKLLEDHQGRLWVLASLYQHDEKEVRVFNPTIDTDPPQTLINAPQSNVQFVEGSAVQVSFQGKDKWKYTEDHRLYYSYRINQAEWSPYQTERLVSLHELPVGNYLFEVRAMDRNWNVDSTPASLQFQVLPPWYKETVFLVVVVGLTIIIIILGLIHARHHWNLEFLVSQRTAELRSLNNDLIVTEDRERKKLAADLHDRIGQSLALCQIEMDAMREMACEKYTQLKLKRISQEIEQTIEDTRSLSFEISPPVLFKVGIESALQELKRQLYQNYGFSIYLHGHVENIPLSDDLKSFLYRSIRELVLNAFKHANVNEAWVEMQEQSDWIYVMVKDHGQGMANKPMKSAGFGLMSIEDRVKYLGGKFDLASSPGTGTTITFSLPTELPSKSS